MGVRGTGGDPTYEHSDAFNKEAAKDRKDGPTEELQGTVTRLIESADRYYSEELEQAQADATDRYHGRPFGDEEDDRSKVVATEVRDAVESILPSLMRIFMGREAPVEFMPRHHDQIDLARQQTDAVNHLVVDREDGFRQLSSIFEDALVRKVGIAKWFVDDAKEVTGESFSNLTLQQIVMLRQDKELSIVDVEEGEPIPGQPATPTQLAIPEQPTFNVRMKRVSEYPRIRFAAVPNEEFRYSAARCLEESAAVVHSREIPESDLIARGIPKDFIERYGKRSKSPVGQMVYDARQFSQVDRREDDAGTAPKMNPILFTEAWLRVDVDGDDIAEWRRFECVGEQYQIRPDEPKGELSDGPPFAVFNMRVLAHMIHGLSVDDFLKDTQRIISQIERGMLDSLALALESKEYVWDGKVNAADLIDPSLLNIVRTFGDPNQVVRVVTHDFIGPAAIPVLEYYEHKREEKIGITKASKGLDADSLQSATKQAVAGTLEKAQERIEMIARSLAETGMRPLFKGMLKLVTQHIDRPMMVRIRGRYVEVDPRGWDADLDVITNVGTGHGSREERIGMLMEIAGDQAAQMTAGSPLVNWTHVRNTRERLIRLRGYNDADEFYAPWGEQQQAQYEQALSQQGQPPDPTMVLAQIEQQKVQIDAMVQQSKLQMEMMKIRLDEMKIALEDDRARDKTARDTALKEYQIDAQHEVTAHKHALEHRIAQDRMAQDADLEHERLSVAAVASPGEAD